MTRKKVKLEWIENNSARRASFRKRRIGLMKKVSELSTLCGVDASIVIYSPDETEPTVWPSHAVVQEQFTKFKSMPQPERMKKMSNHEAYLKEKVSKLLEQLSRTQRRNMESEMNDLMLQIHQGKEIHELNLSELKGLTWFFNEKMKDISRRMEFHRQPPYARGTPHPPLPPPPLQTNVAADETARFGEIGSAGLGGDHGRNPVDTESLLLHQWFMEMMKSKALKSADSNNTRSDKGYPSHPFSGTTVADDHLGLPKQSSGGGSSSVAASDVELGLGLSFGNFTAPPLDMGLPTFRTQADGDANNMGLQPHGSSVGGSNFGPFGADIGLGLGLGLEQGLKRFNEHIGSSSEGSELGLAPLGLSGSSNNGSGIDAEVPTDGKTKPKNSA